MKVLVSLTLALAGCTLSPAQYGFSGAVTNSNLGISIRFESKLEPSSLDQTPFSSAGVTSLDNARPGMRRFHLNTQRHEYFGYDMILDPTDKAKETFRISFKELPANAESLKIQNPEDWHRAQPPVFPLPQTISIDDRVEVTLFEDPVTHQRVIDHIHFTRDGCDGENPSPAQVGCLTGQLQEVRHTLSQELSRHIDNATVRESQSAWQTYLQATCANIVSEPKRLGCQLKLTRNRLRDLGSADSH